MENFTKIIHAMTVLIGVTATISPLNLAIMFLGFSVLALILKQVSTVGR